MLLQSDLIPESLVESDKGEEGIKVYLVRNNQIGVLY